MLSFTIPLIFEVDHFEYSWLFVGHGDIQFIFMIRLLVALSLCLLIHARYPGYSLLLPPGTIDFDYSPDQQFLGLLSETALQINRGIDGTLVQLLTFEEPLSPRSFAFSSDSRLLTVGFENGVIQAYYWQGNTYVKKDQDYVHDVESIINSVCFLADSSAIVAAVYDSKVILWDFEAGTHVDVDFAGVQAKTVACHPQVQNKFVAGGGQGGNYRFQFFEFAAQKINSLNVIEAPGTLVESAAYNGDGSRVYFTAGTNLILAYKSDDFAETLRLQPTETEDKTYLKVRLTANEQLIACVVNGQVVVINNAPQIHLTSDKMASVQTLIYTPINSVALASRGQHIFYSTGTASGQVLNKCDEGQYEDLAGACINCAKSCQICDASPTSCYRCNDRFYLKDMQCYSCAPGCLFCSEQKCTQCGPHFLPPTDFTCTCEPGYYQQGDDCLACTAGCVKCDTQGCQECRAGLELIAGRCVCQEGTYFDGQTCRPCSRGCLACDDADTCRTCDADAHFILDVDNKCVCDSANKFVERDNKCVCVDGYYKQDEQCVSCTLGCQFCTAADECSLCSQGLRLENGFCVCQKSTQFIDADAVCHECSESVPFCIECLKANTCERCEAGSFRNPNTQCGCNAGYYEDNDRTCKLCAGVILGCYECSNPYQCTTCDATNHWQVEPDTGKCHCMKKYQQIDNKCVNCPVGCLTCNAQGQCLECDAAEKWESDGEGQCRCIGGWYQQDDTCRQCMPGCLDCASAEVCNNCDKAANFENVDGTCKCLNSFFLQDRACQKCNAFLPRCNTCRSSPQGPQCSNCDTPFVLVANSCTCEKGKFVDGAACSDCPKQCATCESLTKCTTCVSGYELKEGKCVKKGMSVKTAVLIASGVVALAFIIFELLR